MPLRSPSGCAAAPSSHGRRGARRCRGGHPAPGPRRGARAPGTARRRRRRRRRLPAPPALQCAVRRRARRAHARRACHVRHLLLRPSPAPGRADRLAPRQAPGSTPVSRARRQRRPPPWRRPCRPAVRSVPVWGRPRPAPRRAPAGRTLPPLRQEAVAGVHGVAARVERRGQHQVRTQVGVGGTVAVQAHRSIDRVGVHGVLVDARVHPHGAHAQPLRRVRDAHRDLAAVGDQQAPDRSVGRLGCGLRGRHVVLVVSVAAQCRHTP